jgi:hypothetical protein
MFVINTYAIEKFLNLITLIFGDLFILIILVETLVRLVGVMPNGIIIPLLDKFSNDKK